MNGILLAGCLLGLALAQSPSKSGESEGMCAIEELTRRAFCLIGGGRPMSELESFCPYGVDVKKGWACTNVADTAKCWGVNGFIFLDRIIRDRTYLDNANVKGLIEAYALSWTTNNVVPRRDRSWPWNDDTTARRVQRMSYLYRFASDSWQDSTKALVKRSLDAQADLLMDDSFYTKNHNHGMHQDFALVCYALLVCDDEERRNRVLGKAKSRVSGYWAFVFAKDGVHKEHSPSYAHEGTEFVAIFAELLRSSDQAFAEFAYGYSSRAKRYLRYVAMPNGGLPPIGDSVSKRVQLDPPDAVFPDGGYAVFRSSWADAPEGMTWMLFLAASHSHVHKHGDDLSFILYHRGDLFVEAGKRNYDYANPLTSYAYSGYAHNVMCVDGQDFPVQIARNGFRKVLPSAFHTRITDYSLAEGRSYVTGIQKRYPGILQERTLTYDRDHSRVIIVDRIQAKRQFKATFLFHTAPEIQHVRKAPLEIGLVRQGKGQVAVLTFEGNVSNLFLYSNSSEGVAPYRTWIFNSNPRPALGGLIGVDVDCPVGETLLTSTILLR